MTREGTMQHNNLLVSENNTDGPLVARSLLGDAEAMDELVRRHYSHSLSIARTILRGKRESEDVVQTAYGNAFHRLDSFRNEGPFRTWITRIVVNQCMMHLRQLRKERLLSLEDAAACTRPGHSLWMSNEPTPEEVVIRRQRHTMLLHAVGKLPGHFRETYRLHASGVSIREIAAATGVSLSAAKTRISRCRLMLRVRVLKVVHKKTSDLPR